MALSLAEILSQYRPAQAFNFKFSFQISPQSVKSCQAEFSHATSDTHQLFKENQTGQKSQWLSYDVIRCIVPCCQLAV